MASQFDHDDDEVIAEINMTPLIDIMLVLLILFMVTSSVSINSGIDIDLPATENSAQKEGENPQAIIISLDKGGAIFLQGQEVGFSDLKSELTRLMAELGTKFVILEGDRTSSLGNTVNIMDLAKEAGATKFAIATEEGP